MIEVRNLAFSYPNRPVLRDVSFMVSPGEVVGIVGANGAGKTTLLRVLAMLAIPDGGLVLQEGRNILENSGEFRRHLGYLPETPALYEDMTVKSYLRFRAALKGEPGKRIRRRVTDAVECCRLTELLRRPIGLLSLGQRKRVALADAVLARPKVLLLDDFLAGLDLEMRVMAKEIFVEIASYASVLVTGHEIADMASFCSRFMLLKEGAIASEVDAAGLGVDEVTARVREMLAGGVQ